ncbi:hypothetical protein C4546_02095 [Candidatus Parcubacteria bacterium]|jgi:hypothetical protein|nr:MAG: hypothetical protein C4546_02095 [Candidatus Parcubacteria bacterium]
MKKFFHIAVVALILGLAGWPKTTQAASLTLSPSSASLTVGQSKTISILVVSADQAMNASQGVVSFPTDKLQVTSLAKTGLFGYWTQEPTYSNNSGTVSFAGGLPTPGYKGSGRSVLTVTFKAKKTGAAKISFTSGVILANDGQGTNILTGYGSATLNITSVSQNTNQPSEPSQPEAPAMPSPTVSSSTHPSSDAWYNKSDIAITWSRPNGSSGVSYVLDQISSTVPDEALEENTGTQEFRQTADGIWYFHIRARFPTGWSAVKHFRIQIDTRPPENFTPQVSREGGENNPDVTIIFATTDTLSGIASYAFAYDDDSFLPITSPYTLKKQKAGLHQFTVRATDKAGNSRDAIGQFNVEGSPAPRLTKVPRVVNLFETFSVEGLATEGDTVILLIDGKEVARFLSESYKIDSRAGVAVPEGLILWRQDLKPLLLPGEHNLTAYSVNRFGIESPESVPASFKTLGSVVQIFGMYISTWGLIVSLLLIIFALLLLLVILYERYRHWQKQQNFDINRAEAEINEEIERLQSALDKDIAGTIRSAIREKSVQATTHEKIKTDLVQARSRIDALLEKNIKRKRRSRK